MKMLKCGYSTIKERSEINMFLIAILILEFFLNIWFTANYFIPIIMNSDYAGDAVFAKHLFDTGHYIFSKDWFPTTELYVIHHQLIMVPLFAVFKTYASVWIVTSIISFILISLSIRFFMSCIGATRERTLLAVILFVNPVMIFPMNFSVWFHGYLFYYIMSFIIMGFLCKAYINRIKYLKASFIILVIISFLAGLCGIRMFLMLFVPIVISCIIAFYNFSIKDTWNTFSKMLVGSLSGAILGFVLYLFVLAPLFGAGSVIEGIVINGSETIAENIRSIPEMLILAMNIRFQNHSINSHTIMTGINAFFWLYLLSSVLLELIRKDKDSLVWFLAIFSSATVLLTLVFMLLTGKNEVFVAWARYISLSGYLMIPTFVMTTSLQKIERVRDLVNWGMLCMMVVAALLWARCTINTYGKERQESWREDYVDYLVENGYEFGYATYWNANITTFVSNGLIKVAPINNEFDYSIFEWNTQKSFKDMAPQFVLLTQDEYANINVKDDNNMSNKILYENEKVVVIEP